MRSDLRVRNNHTSEHTLCLWNERTLPTTGFLGFSGQKDFEQEGQDIVPPNVSTSPQDVHLSLEEGQGLGSS